MSELKVRLGRPEEEEAIIDVAIKAWEENGILNIDREKVVGEFRPALHLWEGLVGVIGEKDIEAFILLRIGEMFYSKDKILEEKCVFVAPEYRKRQNRSSHSVGHARVLMEFAKKAADELNLPLIIGVLSTHRAKAKARLYERQFGEQAGAFFLYRAKSGQHAEHLTEN